MCLQVSGGASARPAALAALLRTSPQALPFARRVDLFRALLAEDKAQGRYDRPAFEGGARPIQVCNETDGVVVGKAKAGLSAKAASKSQTALSVQRV